MNRQPLNRRTQLRRVSPKRARENREYAKERDAWLNGRACQHCVGTYVVELHHYRGRIGRLLRDQRFWIALCTECHTHVHNRPEWARRVGLLAPVNEWNVFPNGDIVISPTPKGIFAFMKLTRTTRCPLCGYEADENDNPQQYKNICSDRRASLMKDASSLLAYLHGAFSHQLKPREKDRLSRIHARFIKEGI